MSALAAVLCFCRVIGLERRNAARGRWKIDSQAPTEPRTSRRGRDSRFSRPWKASKLTSWESLSIYDRWRSFETQLFSWRFSRTVIPRRPSDDWRRDALTSRHLRNNGTASWSLLLRPQDVRVKPSRNYSADWSKMSQRHRPPFERRLRELDPWRSPNFNWREMTSYQNYRRSASDCSISQCGKYTSQNSAIV